MEITVIHTLSTEIMNLLKGIISGGIAETPKQPQEALTEFKETGVITTPTKTTKTKAEKTPPANSVPASATKEPAGDITVESLRAAARGKQQSGKSEQLKALLTEFGTESITNLDKEKYSDFLDRLIAL